MACTASSSMAGSKVKHGSFSDCRRSSPYSSFGKTKVLMKLSETHLPRNAIVATSAVEEEARRSTSSSLPNFWKQIHGSNNWEYMVEPLHPLLRQEVIRYGEFVIACYKAFDLDSSSKLYLNCKYGKKSLFMKVGMVNSGYQVTKYIYATPEINIPIQNEASSSRWVGYVATSSDETVKKIGRRDIVVTFRGTVTNPEWIANFMSTLTPARLDPHDSRSSVKVESGFLSLYTSNESCCKFGPGSCREQLLSEISRLLTLYEDEEISITLAGHSMGSALALLLAYDISELGLNWKISGERIPVTVFSFAGPRVGNSSFKQRCDALGVKVLRIVNVNDPITKLPGVLLNENFRALGGRYEFPWSCSCYSHVGIELALDFFSMQNPSSVHDLESYISLLRRPKSAKNQRSEFSDLLGKAMEFLSAAKSSIGFNRTRSSNEMVSLADLTQKKREINSSIQFSSHIQNDIF